MAAATCGDLGEVFDFDQFLRRPEIRILDGVDVLPGFSPPIRSVFDWRRD